MEDGEMVIKKIEKGYELVTRAHNLQQRIKGEIFCHEHVFNIFKTLIRESYYTERQHEFMGLNKPELDKNFAFFTLTMEKKTREIVLKDIFAYNYEKLKVKITLDCGANNPLEL